MKIQTLEKASKLFKGSSILPILDCVMVENNSLRFTDLVTELTIKDFPIHGTFAIDKSNLLDALKMMPNYIATLDEHSSITFKSGSEEIKYTIDVAKDFPKKPVLGNFDRLGKLGEHDRNSIKAAFNFISNDEMRPAMTFVALKDRHIVGTDAHVMFFEPSKFDTDKQVLFSKTVCKLIELFGSNNDLELVYSESAYRLSNDEVEIIWRNPDERYPDFSAVIPRENPIQITLDKKQLLDTLTRAGKFANSATRHVRFEVNGSLVVNAEDLDTNKSYRKELELQSHTGDDIEIGFDYKYLTNALTNVEGQDVTIAMSMPRRAAIINDHLLVMPVMLHNDY